MLNNEDRALVEELASPFEPLLPIEKQLIAWSLGLGIALLILLAALGHVGLGQL